MQPVITRVLGTITLASFALGCGPDGALLSASGPESPVAAATSALTAAPTDTTDSVETGATTSDAAIAAFSFGQPKAIAGSDQDAEPPQIAASGKNVYILWHEFPDAANLQPDVYLSRSTNKGGSFSTKVNLSNSAAVDSRDEDLAVSGKNVFVAWSENADELLFRRSTNNGGSFDLVQQLNVTPGAIRPQVAASGKNVFVVWEAPGQNGNNDIYFAQSSDDGHKFTTEKNLSANDGPSESPQIVKSEDRLVVTWRDSTTPGLDFEIFFTQGK